jgi:ABC-type transport system substrate-binding protein
MKAAGKEAGFEAELMYVNGSLPKIGDLVLSVAADLGKIGISCKVRVFPDFAVAGTFHNTGKFDMFYNSWTTYTLDADMPFWRNWHSTNSREGTGKYDYGKDLDALVEAGRYSLDEKVRTEAYFKAQEYMWNFPTRLALYHSEDLWGVRASVKNFTPTASRILDMFQVSKG